MRRGFFVEYGCVYGWKDFVLEKAARIDKLCADVVVSLVFVVIDF